MASSRSHRQTVVPEISATRPRSIASRATSPALQRLKGTPEVAGNSQAMAFTSILACGGKARGSARAGAILQSRQSFLIKPFAPLTDRLGCGVKLPCDLLVGGPIRGQKDDLGTRHLPVGSSVGAGSLLQNSTLIFGGLDAERTLAGHAGFPFSATQHPPRPYRERRTPQRISVKDHLDCAPSSSAGPCRSREPHRATHPTRAPRAAVRPAASSRSSSCASPPSVRPRSSTATTPPRPDLSRSPPLSPDAPPRARPARVNALDRTRYILPSSTQHARTQPTCKTT